MKHFLSSFGWILAAVVQQWLYHRTGIGWFALAAAGCAVLVGFKYIKFVRTLDND